MNTENLTKFQQYLHAQKPERNFSMDASAWVAAGEDTILSPMGHAILSGIPILHHEDENQYCVRVFQLEYDDYVWLFQAEWANTDNTAAGLCKRIGILLKTGIPHNSAAQITGDAPLSYKLSFKHLE